MNAIVFLFILLLFSLWPRTPHLNTYDLPKCTYTSIGPAALRVITPFPIYLALFIAGREDQLRLVQCLPQFFFYGWQRRGIVVMMLETIVLLPKVGELERNEASVVARGVKIAFCLLLFLFRWSRRGCSRMIEGGSKTAGVLET